MIQPTPLPENPYNVLGEKRWHDAYDKCLQIQPPDTDTNIQIQPPDTHTNIHAPDTYKNDHINTEKNLVYARILGYLLLEAPTPTSRDFVSQEILNCGGDIGKLHDFAELFESSITSIYEHRCRTPLLSYEDRIDFFDFCVVEEPQDHVWAKRSALHRDGYRCMVTPVYDYYHSVLVLTDPQSAKLDKEPGTFRNDTKAWHPLTPLSAKSRRSIKPAASTFLLKFCSISSDELNEVEHSLTNVLTVSGVLSVLLHRLHVWFEAVPDAENTYEVVSWVSASHFRLPSRVTFSTETGLALPSPRYLKMHAAICRVARLSGASKRIEFVKYLYEDDEDEGEDEDDEDDEDEEERVENPQGVWF